MTATGDPRPSLLLVVAPVDAMPGTPCRVEVSVTNAGEQPTGVSLTVAGLEPGWLKLPDRLAILEAGATMVAELIVNVPVGHPPCELTGSVVATGDGGSRGAGDLRLSVLDGSVVSAIIEPPEARGGWRALAYLVLRNRGHAPVRVDLEASSPDSDVRVNFRGSTHILEPGHEVRVRTRLTAHRRMAGAARRRPYAVRVRTRGTPVQVEAAFVQRAVLGSWMSKALALAAVVALWAAVVAVGITDLSKHVNKTANQHAANNAPPLTVASGPSAGGGSGGNGSSGGGGSGGGGSGGSGSAAGGGGAAGKSGNSPSRLSGKVTAAQPGDVTVKVTPTSLTDQSNQVVTAAAPAESSGIQLVSATTSVAKLYGAALPPNPPPTSTPSVDALTTTTSPDGFWAFAAITTPGYYLVAFSKPGYATADYIVNIAGNGKPVTLQAQLVPGNGSLSGTVAGPDGPLGGVQVNITDGTVSLSTRTPTVGSVGTWSVHGLTTPDTYLVTATLPGYSTQTTLVTLGAGASRSGIALSMVKGAGSVSGTVVSSRSQQPVGGLTVTVSNGTASRTTTTTTVATVGSYSLPDLPVPGTYALTISGAGYISETQQVTLTAGAANITVNAVVTPSTSDVTGVASTTDGQGLPGAGAILSNQTNVYKTLTTSSGTVGSFDFGQIVPGQYVLTVEDFGYTTESAQVSVGPGETKTVNLSLPFVGQQSLATATIQGSVASLITAKPIVGAQISLDGQPSTVTTDSNGLYTIHGVNPGTHTVTASCPTSSPCQSLDLSSNQLVTGDFETTTVQVSVALGAVAFAPTVLMPKLDTLAGVVIDGTGAHVPNPVVTLTNSQTGTVYTSVDPPTLSGTTAANGGFEFQNIPHGTYQLNVAGPQWPFTKDCTGVTSTTLYKPLTMSITLQIDTDYLLNGAPGTPNASPVLTLLPVYQVNTEIETGTGTPTPTQNVQVTVTGVAGTPSAAFSAVCVEPTTTAQVPLPEALIGQRFVASFSFTDPTSGVTYSAPQSAPFTAVYNSPNVDTAILVPPAGNVNVSLTFPWRSAAVNQIINCLVTTDAAAVTANCPTLAASDLPIEVRLIGTVIESGGVTAQQSFAATPSTTSPATWTFTSSSLSGLAPGPVTFQVIGGAFQTFSFNANYTPSTGTTSSISSESFTLSPNLGSVSGTVSPFGTSISVSPSSSTLTVLTGPCPQSSGDIVWQESGQTCAALPGVYDVTFSHAGFDSSVVHDFTVGLCDQSNPADCPTTLGIDPNTPPTVSPETWTYAPGTSPVSLIPHVTLTVTPSFTTQSGLALPTVTLKDGAGDSKGSVTLTSNPGSAVFSDLSQTENNYTVTISTPGFQTVTATEDLIADTTITPTLTLEGYFTGTVDGIINTSPSPLQGVTVDVTPTAAGSCPPATSGTPLTDTTGSDGTYTIAPIGGVNTGTGTDCTVTALPPAGYSSIAASSSDVTPVNTGDNAVNLSVQAKLISQTFIVEDSSGAGLNGVTVTGASTIGRTVTKQTATVSGQKGEVTLDVDPTTYTFTFTLNQFMTTSETITYHVNETAPNITVTMTADENTIQGVISTPGTCFGASTNPCPLSGVSVALTAAPGTNSTNTCTNSGSTTTGSDGSYSFTDICDGTYSLTATLSGYNYTSGSAPSPFLTNLSHTEIEDVSLSPKAAALTVTVTESLTSANPLGYTVSLSPATPPTGLSNACVTSGVLTATGEGTSQTATVAQSGKGAKATDVGTFSSVAPDYYDLTVTGTGLPAQATDALLVCPGGNVAEYSPAPATAAGAPTPTSSATFEVAVGQISGTVSVAGGSAINAGALTVTITGTGVTDTVIPTCTNGACQTATFTSHLLPASLTTSTAYTVTATASGYTSPSASVTVPADPTTATAAGTIAAVSPITLSVTVLDNANSNPISGATVTLSQSGNTVASAVTNSNGVATFPSAGVPSGTYDVSVTSNSASMTVDSGSPLTVDTTDSTQSDTVKVETGSISGSVTESSGKSVTVQLCSDSACNTVVTSASVPSSTPTYSFTELAPGTYYVQGLPAPWVTPASPQSVSVTNGHNSTGPTLVYTGSVTVSVSGAFGASASVSICSDSACASPLQSHTFLITQLGGGTVSFTFTGLPPGTDFTKATVVIGTSVSPSGASSVTVTSGTDTTGQTYSVS